MNLAHPSPLGHAAHLLLSRFERLLAHRRQVAAASLPAPAGPAAPQTLQKGGLLALANPLALRLECLEGSLWVTHDGDVKDLIVEAGESYQSERATRMLVYGLSSARLRVVGAQH